MGYFDIYNSYGLDRPEKERPYYHMNCAEILLRTANDEYDLGLDESAFQMMIGFGSGFYSGKTCGSFVGALAALSRRYSEERPSKQEKVKKGAKLLADAFVKEFGSMDCADIKHLYPDCTPIKKKTFELLQEVFAILDKEKESEE